MKNSLQLSIAAVLLFSSSGMAQENRTRPHNPIHDIRVGILNTHMLQRNVWGGALGFGLYLNRRWSSGLCFAAGARKLSWDYPALATEPALSYFEMVWDNRFELYEKGRFSFNLQLNNGLAGAFLHDNATKKRVIGARGTQYRAKKVAEDYYYTVQPGIQANWSLQQTDETTEVLLTTQAFYRTLWGSGSFTGKQDLRGATFLIGITIRGLYHPDLLFPYQRQANSG